MTIGPNVALAQNAPTFGKCSVWSVKAIKLADSMEVEEGWEPLAVGGNMAPALVTRKCAR